tara:strand:+ start:56 stop:289 length:234 start_codon:yes stop_codon:yes gene_type:complete
VSIDTRDSEAFEPSTQQVGRTADMAALRPKSQSATELPRFDGQLMNLGGWLRAAARSGSKNIYSQVIYPTSPRLEHK